MSDIQRAIDVQRIVQPLMKELKALQKRVSVVEKGSRTPQLQNASITNTAITVYDADGETPRGSIGVQQDGTVGVVVVNGPQPPTPSAPTVTPSTLGLTIEWDGSFTDGQAQPSDFDHVAVHLSTTSGFTADASTLKGTLTRAGSISLTPLTTEIHYVVLVAVSASGEQSEQSAESSGTPNPAADIGPGDITETEIADDAISTPKLQAEAVTADKIAANTITAGNISAGAITSEKLAVGAVTADNISAGAIDGQIITGAQLVTYPGPGSVLNANPEFDSGMTGWTAGGGTATAVTAPVQSGSNSCQITPAGGGDAWIVSDQVPVGPGQVYTASFWVQATEAYGVSGGHHYALIYAWLVWYDASHTQIGQTFRWIYFSNDDPAFAALDTWGFMQWASTAPANAAYAALEIAEYSIGNYPASTSIFYVDSATITDYSGGALLAYSGDPAAGNLVASISPAGGTDPYGNHYPQGINATTGAIAGADITGADITGGTLNGATITGSTIQTADSGARVAIYDQGGQGIVEFYDDGGSEAGRLRYDSGEYVALESSDGHAEFAVANFPSLKADLYDAASKRLALMEVEEYTSGSQTGLIRLTTYDTSTGTSVSKASLSISAANGGYVSVTTAIRMDGANGIWTPATLKGGWSNRGTGFPIMQYRKVASPPNTVEVIGEITGGTITDGTTLFTLPSVLAPNVASTVPIGTAGTTSPKNNPPVAYCDTSGNVKCYNVGTGTSTLQLHLFIPLDAN